MELKRTKLWYEADQTITGLDTDINHLVEIQREAIPLVFIPGIMGSRLRKAGTTGTKKAAKKADLPDLRWDPSDLKWMAQNYLLSRNPQHRKEMLVGTEFKPTFLEVDDSEPFGDGFNGIMSDYHEKFLTPILKHWDWGLLDKVFVFPVYAIGYNWTASVRDGGQYVAERIGKIIKEARAVTGLCEKVIVLTHSMGGIVARSASVLAGAESKILGIVHAVQPGTGAPAGYWRMKGGFEATSETSAWHPIDKAKEKAKAKGGSMTLGGSSAEVTAILANIPGGLQLLPNKLHRTNADASAWLTVTEKSSVLLALPVSDPYEEIYRVKAEVRPPAGKGPSSNKYWGLVDPDLLDPQDRPNTNRGTNNDLDAASGGVCGDPWLEYLRVLKMAEKLHDDLRKRIHPSTLCIAGTGHRTADVVELRVESNWVHSDPYGSPGSAIGFKGLYRDASGKDKMAVMQEPDGEGDGTVAKSSATALNGSPRPAPGDAETPVQHQPAYEDGALANWAIKAVMAMCKEYYEGRRKSCNAAASHAGGQ